MQDGTATSATEHVKYIDKLKLQIKDLKRSSKLWWRLSRELLEKKSSNTSVPSLRNADGHGIRAMAKKLKKSLNFQVEGVLRGGLDSEGKAADSSMYGLLREELGA